MKEVTFINKNAKKWENFEAIIDKKDGYDADEVSSYYIKLTDNLAYAKTYYPDSKVTVYLNQLARKAHQAIYRNKKVTKGRVITFWTDELPLINYKFRRFFLYALIFFTVSMAIGFISVQDDLSFVRMVMGDGYVNMTIENIKAGDPMAVYHRDPAMDSFLSIAYNNIRVSFSAFFFGLFFSLGTIIVMFLNGLMLGAFNAFLFQYGVLGQASMSIWVHGTIEISVIIIAGGAGLLLGKSIFFPGTYKRGTSFQYGVRNGVKIIIGLMPLFIFAALLEGFVTRYTQMPIPVSLAIIFASLAFIIWYFVLFPQQKHKKLTTNG